LGGFTSLFNSLFYKEKRPYINYKVGVPDIIDNNRFVKKRVSVMNSILLTKGLIKHKYIKNNNFKEFSLINVNFNKEKTIEQKIFNNQQFLVLKQKRYKRKKNIPLRTKYYKDTYGNRLSKLKFSDKPDLVSNSFFEYFDFEPTKLYNLVRKAKNRSELISVQFSRRMLRTKKTLILPSHVNVTIVTNSYDVVHSWFIPGLGIKLDCVPGRSTHHSFYSDSVGFYYGQCAEICGRYHHHMPIRICLLPFEHFVI
jgi:hypothetical protein